MITDDLDQKNQKKRRIDFKIKLTVINVKKNNKVFHFIK